MIITCVSRATVPYHVHVRNCSFSQVNYTSMQRLCKQYNQRDVRTTSRPTSQQRGDRDVAVDVVAAIAVVCVA